MNFSSFTSGYADIIDEAARQARAIRAEHRNPFATVEDKIDLERRLRAIARDLRRQAPPRTEHPRDGRRLDVV